MLQLGICEWGLLSVGVISGEMGNEIFMNKKVFLHGVFVKERIYLSEDGGLIKAKICKTLGICPLQPWQQWICEVGICLQREHGVGEWVSLEV
jgi:hypothetical protein